MNMSDQLGSGGMGLFFAFAGGALVGGVAALLLAPRTGAQTRKLLAGKFDDSKELASRVPQAYSEASTAAKDAFSAALNGGA
jgi:gas vesicle protein